MEMTSRKMWTSSSEFTKWLEVRKRFSGASWYRAEHKMLTLTGATDASSSGWGGLIRSVGYDVLNKARVDFHQTWQAVTSISRQGTRCSTLSRSTA